MEGTGFLMPWKPSEDDFSSEFSFPSDGMDDLPFSLEDLPPEIRDKIDEIIEKNEDLNTQLEAIDELLFADRPLAKFDCGTKFEIGSESGIGSDSDSGNGILPSTDPLNSSSTSTTFSPHPVDEGPVIDPLRRTPLPIVQDADDSISRFIAPRPLPLPPNVSSNSDSHNKSILFIPRSAASSLSQTVRYQQSSFSATISRNQSPLDEMIRNEVMFPVPPPHPLGFDPKSGKDSRGVEYNFNDDESKVVRTNEKSLVTIEGPKGSRSSPSSSPREERSFNASRTLIKADEGKVQSGQNTNRISKSNGHLSQNSTTEFSSSMSNSLSKDVSLSRSTSRKELFAWEDVLEASIHPQSTVHSSKSGNSEKSLSAIRPSQLSLESSQRAKMFLKKDESSTDSVIKNISTPSRYSENMIGSTADQRRKNWRPLSGLASKVKAETKISQWNVEGRSNTLDYPRNDLQNTDEEKKETTSDDDFSNLVQLRDKKGKPAQMVRINHKTLKAKSMLSLYDPSSDAKERSNEKKSNKKETGSLADSKKRLSALFQWKLKFNKSKDGKIKQSNERSDMGNAVTSKEFSETELQRSDYLNPTFSLAPTRCNIPSPSLYPSMDTGPRTTTSNRPSGISSIREIFRVEARDLSVDDDRPPLTFNTFRGQIEPIRWREENRRTHAPTTKSSLVSVELSSEFPSNISRLSEINTKNSLNHRNDHHLNTAQHLSTEKFDNGKSITDGGQSISSRELIAKGHPVTTPPMIRVANPPASNRTPSQSYLTGLFTVSGKADIQAISINDSSSRIFNNGFSDPMKRNNSSYSGHDLLDNRTCGHQREPSRKPLTSKEAFSTNNSLPKKESIKTTEDHSSDHEERRVLQTTYDDASGCERAVSDTRQMLSSLLADRERILSATSGSSSALYRSRKDSLAVNCRHLVTEAKLMVSGATRSRQDLTNSLTAVLHTFARVFESCRPAVTALPLDSRRETLLDEVLKVGDAFLNVLSSSKMAAGRGQNDPAMGQLMYHTTDLAQTLARLVNIIKSIGDWTTNSVLV